MYYINKIVGWILSPLGILFIGLASSWVLRAMSRGTEKRRSVCVRLSNWAIGLTVVFMWIISCSVTTRFIGAALERDWVVDGKPHGDIGGLPSADAIVVLGGGMGWHPKCGVSEMFGAADRVWQGCRLYKAGLAKVMLLSGPDVEKSTVPLLIDMGVPKEAFMYFSTARNTEEESKLIYATLVKVCDGRRPKILLVTSAWHMNRAKLLFERVGFDVIPAPADFEMSYGLEFPIGVADFFPSCDALSRNSYCIKEWVGNVGYRLLKRR